MFQIDRNSARRFSDTIECFNLKQIMNLSTRVMDKTTTLIDLILVSNNLDNYKSGVDKPNNSSDHFLLYCKYSVFF